LNKLFKELPAENGCEIVVLKYKVGERGEISQLRTEIDHCADGCNSVDMRVAIVQTIADSEYKPSRFVKAKM
jgi:hypothetical protein